MSEPPTTEFNPNTEAVRLIDKLLETCDCKTELQRIREEVVKVEYDLWSAKEIRAFHRWRYGI